MCRAVVVAALIAGCHAELGGATSGLSADAGSGGPAGACSNGRVVYLVFEGVTLTKAATDATANHAAWLGMTTATVPPYHAGASNRSGQIQSITSQVRDHLSSFPITVVTTRPAAGPYVMVALGGERGDVGTQYSYATGDHDCGDQVKSDVVWVSDVVPDGKVADNAIGAIAWALGLNGTNSPADCMCGWSNNCVQSSSACTLSSSIATTSNAACAGLATQDEVSAFHQAFCE